MQALQGAVLAAVLTAGLGLALPQDYMPAAHADNSFVSAAERRRQEALQRKELLTKAREEALRKGGVDPSSTESAPELATPAADAKVEAANAEVEASNKEREGLSSSMLARLKKAAGDYEKTAGSGPKLPKEEPSGGPSWSSLFQSQEPEKADSPAAPSAAPTPAPAAAPQKPSLPFQMPKLEKPSFNMPKFEAPKFEKVQVPSFGTKQEPASAPVAPPSPPPAPAAKVVPPPPPPPAQVPAPARKVELPAPSPAASTDEDSSGTGAWFKSLTEGPTKTSVPELAAPKAEAKKTPAPQTVIKPLPSRSEPAEKEAPAKKPVKAAAVVSKPGKRQGPLPLWLAELLVIFGLAGILYSVVRWSEQIAVYWGKLGAQLETVYEKIDKRAASPPKA
ncbi:hypothetical protein COCSUDRAFT_63785 [Coccomyxa subellipsoidea C-169]|uniref:Uncharacterized protein n=1 Tax=Coccomyxa subellipsoidea (strain C-169) TaxID=574566 RepID=I0YW74_COCSC|nr:hypothetical protein COCSUDRAFT_63785 [Coccomyxa subellipsoidea C-169]EIE22643.1 hypothetical protein COCSUDRAFT_63785 [Coccomyxa subellipsoidea C-169]|eukprot:XP_005647187.1 hypothetical protein COCSUDRAFT_63785 [Coccomyxa subellipsoidea C-169]